jgi:hypothetical protein
MTPEEIIAEMVSVYRSTSAYEDEFVTTWGDLKKTFKTYFVAPKYFRVEYPDQNFWVDKPGGRYKEPPDEGTSVEWSDGEGLFRKRFYEPKAHREESIEKVVGTTRVLRILLDLPAQDKHDIRAISNLERIADQVIADSACYCLVGTTVSLRDTEICISAEGFTLRRVRYKNWFGTMETLGIADDVPSNDSLPFSNECVYQGVKLNGEIDKSLFTPPDVL